MSPGEIYRNGLGHGNHVAGIFYGHMHTTINGNYENSSRYTLGNIRSFCVGGVIDNLNYVDVTARVDRPAETGGDCALKVSAIRRLVENTLLYDLVDSTPPTSREDANLSGGKSKTEGFQEYTVHKAKP